MASDFWKRVWQFYLKKLAAFVITCSVAIITFTVVITPAAMGKFENDIIGNTFYCLEQNPCVVKDNPGGYQGRFVYAAKALQRGERSMLVIDGQCISACVFTADLGRPRVCITPNAVFGFHKGAFEILGETFYSDDAPLSPDILRWVKGQGGLPLANTFEELLFMRFEEAKWYWPQCSTEIMKSAQASAEKTR